MKIRFPRGATSTMRSAKSASGRAFACGLALAIQLGAAGTPASSDTTAGAGMIFLIGRPDGSPMEFGLTEKRWPQYQAVYPDPVVFEANRSPVRDWPYIHPSHHDRWAGSRAHTFTVRFNLKAIPPAPQTFIIGLADSHTPSQISIGLNGREIASRQAPRGRGVTSDPEVPGQVSSLLFPIPPAALHSGTNDLTITLSGGSWIIYDYLYLGSSRRALPLQDESAELTARFLEGPMAGVNDLVFAVRKVGFDGHWYANIGYYSEFAVDHLPGSAVAMHHGKRVTYRPGGRLGRLDVRTSEVAWLIDDPEGGVRDPVVHYDGRTILFAWRKGDGEHYHLYTIQSDGSGLRQLTSGDFDDFEPCWLPDGGIVFVSTRARRWVNCWITQVATLHRCDADGGNLRMISANIEQDNTPWVLPDGRILYQRWEYVDRSQVDYHHLWTARPDGTSQMVFFGNQTPGTVMIDAKPIPGSRRIIAIFSPGHGRAEHAGALTLVDPIAGPDESGMARRLGRGEDYRDPWAFSEDAFMAARGPEIRLVDSSGASGSLYRLGDKDMKEGFVVHEPRPLVPSERERIIEPAVETRQGMGRVILANVYEGRNMEGLRPGDIKKLLVLESLPKPVNFTGGMDPLTYGGSFTLERVLGTVPVEPDGSAFFELPALRGLFFVALDENDLSVKRMQSFLSVQPGEVVSCVGCHEQRTRTYQTTEPLQALRRPPHRIEPIADCPDVFDFPRDIQPILDRLCVECHDARASGRGGPYAGGLLLSGDHGPMFSHSYFSLTVRQLFSDGRNEPRSGYPPRALGSSASRILKLLDGSHHEVRATEHDRKMIRLWIEAGAPYPGTYAALGSGMIGGYRENVQVHTDFDWPTTRAGASTMDRRCGACHVGERRLPHALSDELELSFWRFSLDDPRLRFSRHIVFNLSRPDQSLLLQAPLGRAAGGLGICRAPENDLPVFTSQDDPDYRAILAMVTAGMDDLESIKRFDMTGFRPHEGWLREMRRFGILPVDAAGDGPVDYYAADQDYWRSLWFQPVRP